MSVRVAVFGLNQGLKIGRDLKLNPDADLVAVAGMGQQAIDAAEELGAPLYEDYNELLKEVPLDAVAIALPNFLHEPATKAAVEAGVKTILLEKPIANTVEEGERIIAMCKEAGVTLLIGHHRRSSSKYLFLREFLDSGRLGDIVGVQSVFAIAKDKDYHDVEWRQKKGGGPLLINGIHDIDDINFVTGMTPARVYAASRNTIRGFEVEDSVSVLIEFKEGPTATYFLSDGTPGAFNYDLAAMENIWWFPCPGENSIRIFGTKGSFGFPNMDFYYYPNPEEEYGWRYALRKEHFPVRKNDPMTSEINHFIDLAMGRETVPRCTGEQGLNTLKVINAILDSAETRQVVDID